MLICAAEVFPDGFIRSFPNFAAGYEESVLPRFIPSAPLARWFY
jgi:hypothetical protein